MNSKLRNVTTKTKKEGNVRTYAHLRLRPGVIFPSNAYNKDVYAFMKSSKVSKFMQYVKIYKIFKVLVITLSILHSFSLNST